ncbi:MAG TPA: phosphonopyruvate decarboxylase [Acidimicrobiia bacterium]|nr:phosphonopyruvate decarboxylase [Acidimicrobiia bacterium]
MSLTASRFLSVLRDEGVSFFTGVADSLLRPLNSELESLAHGAVHIPAPNEGSAVALAAGHHLATGNIALVYLQNSGLGNTVNPLLSLADPGVYGIPMLLLVGWRGEPGRPDEPQHLAQGQLTRPMLDLLGIPNWVLPQDAASAEVMVKEALARSRADSAPVALVVPKGTITGEVSAAPATEGGLTRGAVLEVLLDSLPPDTVFIATTGYTGRELAQLRVDRGEPDDRDVLVVGSMGHAISIALGVALSAPDATVCCVDGDGSFAMHMGAVAAVGRAAPSNLTHVLVNNRVHESVGGQPTAVDAADLAGVAAALGYPTVVACRTAEEVQTAVTSDRAGPRFVEVKVTPGAPDSLIRPEALNERKVRLMAALDGA